MSGIYIFQGKLALSFFSVPIYIVAILAILATTNDADYFYCMAMVSTGPFGNFPILAFFITLALLVTFIYFEEYELFTTYFNCNWNIVRLVCYYGNLPAADRRRNRALLHMIIARYWLYSITTTCLPWRIRRQAYTDVRMKQVSILDYCSCGPVLGKLMIYTRKTTSVYLADKAKKDIIHALKEQGTLTVSLPRHRGAPAAAVAPTNKSATEIILASHLATELFLMKHPGDGEATGTGTGSARTVATTLSRYCMYLVARMPELLPDDEVWVSGRFEDMRTCLHNVLRPGRRCCI